MRQLFEATPTWVSTLATVGFFGLFCFVIWYALADRRRGHNDRMSALPLDREGDQHG